MGLVADALRKEVLEALSHVYDPEIRRPITELGMVDALEASDTGVVRIRILLTVPGCPLKDVLEAQIGDAVGAIKGVGELHVEMDVMDEAQRQALMTNLRGGETAHNPFADQGLRTRVIAVSSGKGGVGKSSITINLAIALAQLGYSVGLLDADIYGHSIPDMLGLGGVTPNVVENAIMPVNVYGVATLSIGMMKEERSQVIAWRGPVLNRALTQFLTDAYWGDLDYLIVDMPPGTGDVAMSVASLLPTSKVLVVTTPQIAASEVAERAGTLAKLLDQDVIGVVENMSWLEVECPDCATTHRHHIFGEGGGAAVAATLTQRFEHEVPLLAQVPLDETLRSGGDAGQPIVVAAPDHPAAQAIVALAKAVATS
ncbi:MAG: Mrp/NBP35 family ATP-binding protein [Propionibacteriaceae bacterium]|jgi:ATP-binding protein involved in chromosome partitioning|nr:Mrp/NBP35 family ATP-binding protein [Propionibacteriaceae bacterium]